MHIGQNRHIVIGLLDILNFLIAKNIQKTWANEKLNCFLGHLAVKENVAESTQRQAFNAIIFLYKQVLDISIDEAIEHRRAKKHKRVPVVMTKNEVKSVIQNMTGYILSKTGKIPALNEKIKIKKNLL